MTQPCFAANVAKSSSDFFLAALSHGIGTGVGTITTTSKSLFGLPDKEGSRKTIFGIRTPQKEGPTLSQPILRSRRIPEPKMLGFSGPYLFLDARALPVELKI